MPFPGQTRIPACSLWMRKPWSTTLPQMQGKQIAVSALHRFVCLWSAMKCLMWIVIRLSCHNSAVIEHTNRVIFLEDDDVAAVTEGRLSIHRIKRTAGDYPARAIQTLQMELQQIMKGERVVKLKSSHCLPTIYHTLKKSFVPCPLSLS